MLLLFAESLLLGGERDFEVAIPFAHLELYGLFAFASIVGMLAQPRQFSVAIVPTLKLVMEHEPDVRDLAFSIWTHPVAGLEVISQPHILDRKMKRRSSLPNSKI